MNIANSQPKVEKYVNAYRTDYEKILKIKPGITDYGAIKYIDEESILSQFDDVQEAFINEVLPKKLDYIKNIYKVFHLR
ncbi:MAG: hypothetical protein ACTSUX_07170 [Promethearchaeota archaeon]